jgi:ABC-type bacteriocin/lantibiotic exporter with double-glycine peptidase domain
MKNLSGTTTESPSLLRKVAAFVLTMAMFALVLMFSVLLFAVVLTAGAIALVYFWWNTRELRKQMRKRPPGAAVIEGEIIEGEVIEGEVIREIDSQDRK